MANVCHLFFPPLTFMYTNSSAIKLSKYWLQLILRWDNGKTYFPKIWKYWLKVNACLRHSENSLWNLYKYLLSVTCGWDRCENRHLFNRDVQEGGLRSHPRPSFKRISLQNYYRPSQSRAPINSWVWVSWTLSQFNRWRKSRPFPLQPLSLRPPPPVPVLSRALRESAFPSIHLPTGLGCGGLVGNDRRSSEASRNAKSARAVCTVSHGALTHGGIPTLPTVGRRQGGGWKLRRSSQTPSFI